MCVSLNLSCLLNKLSRRTARNDHAIIINNLLETCRNFERIDAFGHKPRFQLYAKELKTMTDIVF